MSTIRIREQFTVEDCNICGMGESYCLFTAECKASVEIRVKEKTLRTKSGAEYIVAQKEYALVVCQKPTPNESVTFEYIENVQFFNAFFTFIMPDGNKENYEFKDITPVRIDLDGDWVFSISDLDGDKLCRLNAKAMMRIP